MSCSRKSRGQQSKTSATGGPGASHIGRATGQGTAGAVETDDADYVATSFLMLMELDSEASDESLDLLAKAFSNDDSPISYFLRSQVFGEQGLNRILDVLILSGHRGGMTRKYIKSIATLLICLKNTAAIEYVARKREDLFPCMLFRLGFRPRDRRMGMVIDRLGLAECTFRMFALCLMTEKPCTLPHELIHGYDILDHVAAICRARHKDCLGDYAEFKDEAMAQAAHLLYLIATFGDDGCRQQIRSHECFELLTEYTPLSDEECSLPDFMGKLKDALDGKEMDIAKLEPFERIANMYQKRYLVFCSLPSCRQMAVKEGVLQFCAKCKLARYCDRKCQLRHWKALHKNFCLGQEKNRLCIRDPSSELYLGKLQPCGWEVRSIVDDEAGPATPPGEREVD